MSTTGEATYCNARLRQNGHDPGELPKREPSDEWAGEGYCQRQTETPRCRMHGGANTDEGRPPSHGLYSGRADDLQEKFEAAFGDDRIGSMRAEIAVLKALLSDFWERIDEVDADTIDAAVKLQGEVRKSLNTASKIEKRHAVGEEEIAALVTGMANLIDTYVDESERADAIAELQKIAGNASGRDRLESVRADG